MNAKIGLIDIHITQKVDKDVFYDYWFYEISLDCNIFHIIAKKVKFSAHYIRNG